jgi:cell fate regulator YaaT (PSP1 superfamily)
MERVIGIRFREGGKIYHFNPGDLELKKGDYVIVHTEQGVGFGQVVQSPQSRDPQMHPADLKKVERLANDEEIRRARENARQEREAKQYCLECIHRQGLAMNLVDVEYFYDNSKIIFYFTADGRVDFRELVKELVRHFKTRVELRQIGVRNQARMVGGLGGCGRELCCSSFLRDFQPVSVKMAKEQNLSLNPVKISGACGRLMCCLKYEYDTYKLLKKDMPKLGKKVETPEGRGKVIRQNVLERCYTVILETGKEVEITLAPLESKPSS